MGYGYQSEKEKLLKYGELAEVTGTRIWYEKRGNKQPILKEKKTTEYELLETRNE
jgi:hypothetical protein